MQTRSKIMDRKVFYYFVRKYIGKRTKFCFSFSNTSNVVRLPVHDIEKELICICFRCEKSDEDEIFMHTDEGSTPENFIVVG